MAVEKVWLRFERKKKDGSMWKLRIQDMPPELFDQVIDLRLTYFARDEAVHRATGITKNPEAMERYRMYVTKLMSDPSMRTVICCEDSGDKVGEIMGTSTVALVTEDFNWDEIIELLKENSTDEIRKLVEVFHGTSKMYHPMEELNVDLYLDDHAILVVPDCRGHGIAQQFLKTRRLMCAELNVSKTGAWMTGYGTQIAAARDGWETVFEVKYEDLARTHDLVFEDAPPTQKYMVAGPLKE